jgi:hypothetical protein
MQNLKLADAVRQLKIFLMSSLLHILLEEARAEIDIWQKSQDHSSEVEIELLAELSCALKSGVETRWLQIREFALGLLLFKAPQMPQGLEYMEEEFIKDYNNNLINRARISGVCGITVHTIFGLIDPISLPTNYIFSWILRYGTISIFLLTLGCTFTKSGKRNFQIICCLVTILAGTCINGMIGLSNPGEIGYNNYYVGIVLVILWINGSKCLRFTYSFISSFLIAFGYWGVAIFYQEVLQNQDTWNYFVTNNFFLVSSILLSLVASYSIEKQDRLEFLARKIIVPGAIQEFHQYCEERIPIDYSQLQDFLYQNPRPQNLEVLVNSYKKFFLK